MIVIRGELTDLNTYISAERSNRFMGAKIKKENTEMVIAQMMQTDNRKQEKIDKPCRINIRWYTRNERKDADNISFSKKFILDGLVKSGILKDDTRKWIRGFTDDFFVDASFPRIEIEFEVIDYDESIEKRMKSKNRKQIIQYDLKGNMVTKWKSGYQIYKITGGHMKWQTIGKACLGQRLTAYGFIWRYSK